VDHLVYLACLIGTHLRRKRLDELADELVQGVDRVRVAPLRNAAFSLQKACSIGLRSGE
jgi:hypothetical protein